MDTICQDSGYAGRDAGRSRRRPVFQTVGRTRALGPDAHTLPAGRKAHLDPGLYVVGTEQGGTGREVFLLQGGTVEGPLVWAAVEGASSWPARFAQAQRRDRRAMAAQRLAVAVVVCGLWAAIATRLEAHPDPAAAQAIWSLWVVGVGVVGLVGALVPFFRRRARVGRLTARFCL